MEVRFEYDVPYRHLLCGKGRRDVGLWVLDFGMRLINFNDSIWRL